MRGIVAVVLASLLLAGCADPAAVRAFAAAAPPAGRYGGMVAFYTDRVGPGIGTLSALTHGACPLAPPPAERALHDLDPLHRSWIAYMAALGRLADGKAGAPTGPAADSVKAGLTGLAAGFPEAGLSPAMIARAGDLTRLLADLVVAGIQQDALRSAIAHADPAFQAAIAIETTVIRRVYLPDLRNYRAAYATRDKQLRYSLDATVPPADRPFPPARATAMAGCLVLLDADGDLIPPPALTARMAAARAYAGALDKLAAAHRALVRSGPALMSSATVAEIAPLLADARAAWGDFATVPDGK